MSSKPVICLFVKPPVPGRVKTRLARELGAEQACRVYRSLVEPIVAAIHDCGLPLTLFFGGELSEQLPESWRCHALSWCRQEGADLGERMTNAFLRLFAEGHRKVLLCGSDIVGLDECYLQKAAAVLERSGMVIAPAHDGGYCLIGCTVERFSPAIFEQISWSTDQVLDQTLYRCRSAGLAPAILDTLQDIDTLTDLKNAAPHLLKLL